MASLGLLLLGAGGWIAYREALPYFFQGGNGTERVVAALAFSSSPPISSPSRRSVLLDCTEALEALNSLEMRFLGEDVRGQVVDYCDRLAMQITATAPTDAFAWFVAAQASASREDWAGMNRRLDKSRQMGPNELWVAQFRARLAEDHYGALDEATSEGRIEDIKMLVTSGLGIRAVAERYVRDPAFRERVTQIVETLPELDQRRFATNVRLAAQASQVGPG
jgi:hypothetical protein